MFPIKVIHHYMVWAYALYRLFCALSHVWEVFIKISLGSSYGGLVRPCNTLFDWNLYSGFRDKTCTQAYNFPLCTHCMQFVQRMHKNSFKF